jgi:hypothetical protein
LRLQRDHPLCPVQRSYRTLSLPHLTSSRLQRVHLLCRSSDPSGHCHFLSSHSRVSSATITYTCFSDPAVTVTFSPHNLATPSRPSIMPDPAIPPDIVTSLSFPSSLRLQRDHLMFLIQRSRRSLPLPHLTSCDSSATINYTRFSDPAVIVTFSTHILAAPARPSIIPDPAIPPAILFFLFLPTLGFRSSEWVFRCGSHLTASFPSRMPTASGRKVFFFFRSTLP